MLTEIGAKRIHLAYLKQVYKNHICILVNILQISSYLLWQVLWSISQTSKAASHLQQVLCCAVRLTHPFLYNGNIMIHVSFQHINLLLQLRITHINYFSFFMWWWLALVNRHHTIYIYTLSFPLLSMLLLVLWVFVLTNNKDN